MVKGVILVLLATAAASGLTRWEGATNHGDAPSAAAVATSAVVATLAIDESSGASYIGSHKCKMCHIKQYKSWQKTKMASALQTLKPGQATDVKRKFNLDPDKDYSTEATCLKCHTTGYGHPGGYLPAKVGDKKSVRHAKALANVGCESCHGPGSEYIKVFKEIFRSKRKYKQEELYAAGLTKMGESACLQCHNDEGPTKAAEPFNFETMKAKGTHEHFPLKQREP